MFSSKPRENPDGSSGLRVGSRDADRGKALKIAFVTLVYDGMPFLRHHPRVFQRLNIPWEWHIVEGVALLRHDTAWSVASGGRVPAWAMKNSLSTDGTTEFLDQQQKKNPDRIFVYRKPRGEYWDGKIEMERAYLPSLREPCLLWEVSSDELWAPWQIENVVRLFRENPARTSAWFWCNFYVGPNAVVSSRHGYSQNPEVEWLRAYRYQPGDDWQSHEPNVLVGRRPPFYKKVNIGTKRPFTHAETEAVGAVFDHFAFATVAQIKFKEQYYGYRNLRRNWLRLQRDVRARLPVRLRDYFAWVKDGATVTTPAAIQVKPMAVKTARGWKFRSAAATGQPQHSSLFILDGAWRSSLAAWLGEETCEAVFLSWARDGFSRQLLHLDRTGTDPDWPGIMKVRSSKLAYLQGPLGGLFLDHICRKNRARMIVLGSANPPFKTAWLKMQFSRQQDQKPFRISCQTKSGKREVQVVTKTAADRLAGTLRKIFETHLELFEKREAKGKVKVLP